MKGKTIVVTGGGNGIGKAVARMLLFESANVIITDKNEDAGHRTFAELHEEYPGKVDFLPHDISSQESWEQVKSEVLNRYERVNGLFNNAGVFLIKPLVDTSVDDFHKIMNVNVLGTFLGMKTFIPHLVENGGGSIVNNSSTAGLVGAKNVSLYGMSKGAIRTLTKHGALEYADKQVRINAVFPGFVDTEMMRHREDREKNEKVDYQKGVPLGRIGNSEEIARTVLFLLSDQSLYTTGAEFIIDGGRTISASY
ncbi:SDR family NAD(P)-dependent oxidoreductase [Geomicrobium sp. JSM 1781026]|uniref:SDR family NAD(P)-dependent oxidoreductase n=1 Tax=unclassified Geomicrobium TaxID=2628951 RepID=UPI00045F10F2|nr:SDR family oxidoreductase [Geomicrobium sp. JCM 19039]GAK13257.1 3-oxoacyl-[acyl-carrier protein] reductase [Geomicrobium sp. JCM 19039]